MSKCDKLVDIGPRQFLRGSGLAAAGGAAAAVTSDKARAVAGAPEVTHHLTFKSQEYRTS